MGTFNLGRQFSQKVRRLHSKVFYDWAPRWNPRWFSSPLYAKEFNAKWYKVYEQGANKYPPPVHFGALTENLQQRLDAEFFEAGLLELNDALIYGIHGWIFSKEGYLLPEHSWYGHHVNEMKKGPRSLPKGKHLRGVCLSLASDFAVGGYGHFVIDSISRLELFYKSGFRLTDVDHIFIPKPTPGNAQFLFDQLNIPVNKCIWAGENIALRVDTLLAPTFPGMRRNYPSWVPKFLQREFLPLPPQPSRRLYISRNGYKRNPENIASVMRILNKHDFEIYDPTEHIKSHYDFSEATTVVGASGSGLTGLAFCQPGTKVLELISTDHVYPYYYTLSNAAGLEYGCLVCQSTKKRGQKAIGASSYNFYVDEEEFDNALTRITGETKLN